MEFVPIFVSLPESEGGGPAGRPRRTGRLVVLGIATLIVFLLTLRVLPMLFPILAIMVGAILILGLGVLIGAEKSARSQQQGDAEKRKRGLDGRDTYALIDRLVGDLDDDELIYLRRRIEDRENAAQPLPETLLKRRAGDGDADLR